MIKSLKTSNLIAGLAARAPNSVSVAENRAAIRDANPLLVTLDAMLRAAEMWPEKYDCKICDDYFTGPLWLQCAKAARDMLCADFGPFDNGTGEAIFWAAMDAAGFTESDL